MSCCGKAKVVKNIVVGNINYAIGVECEFTDGRIRICQKCGENTWMTKAEYLSFLLKHGIKILKNIEDLTVLPELPKHELEKGRRNLYCRLCKCFIPAKARIEKEKCPLSKWTK